MPLWRPLMVEKARGLSFFSFTVFYIDGRKIGRLLSMSTFSHMWSSVLNLHCTGCFAQDVLLRPSIWCDCLQDLDVTGDKSNFSVTLVARFRFEKPGMIGIGDIRFVTFFLPATSSCRMFKIVSNTCWALLVSSLWSFGRQVGRPHEAWVGLEIWADKQSSNANLCLCLLIMTICLASFGI